MAAAIPMNWRGRTIYVETSGDAPVVVASPANDEDLPDSLAPVADRGQSFDRLAFVDFDQVVDLVTTCSNALIEAMEKLVQPDEASIEFGVKIAGEAGIPILTKLSSEGSIKVTVVWKKAPLVAAPSANGNP